MFFFSPNFTIHKQMCFCWNRHTASTDERKNARPETFSVRVVVTRRVETITNKTVKKIKSKSRMLKKKNERVLNKYQKDILWNSAEIYETAAEIKLLNKRSEWSSIYIPLNHRPVKNRVGFTTGKVFIDRRTAERVGFD